MQTETILYIIIAGILALLVALFQYMYKSKKRSKRYVLLTFLRFLTLFSVLSPILMKNRIWLLRLIIQNRLVI
jgi:RsiW-degrading membrane proteinase PrsW (M82 family)